MSPCCILRLTMKTLQIGNDWPEERVGGLNRYYVELLRHLPQTGTQVSGLVVGSPAVVKQTKGAVQAFARRTDSLPRRMLLARRAAVAQLRGGNIDLIASHFALYGVALADWAGRVPTVVHFHGPWAAESNVEGAGSPARWFKQALERSIYQRAGRLIVLSKAFQSELVSHFGVDEGLTRVVPGGIDTERFNIASTRAKAREKLGWPTDRPILLAVRRLVRRMGLENLIDAMERVSEASPESLLLIGGSGPLADELRARVQERKLESRVRLLGRIEEADLPTAYRAADFTVVPTQSLEGFGMITLESLASGTPVLVTPVGGLPEVVQPFSPDCVFGDTSTTEIAAVLAEVLGGRRRLPSEEACRAYAVDRFAWPRIASEVRDVYTEALR